MNATTEAYRYYKELYAPFIIFFRVNNYYKAYYEDAKNISNTLHLPIKDECVNIPAGKILDVVGELSSYGLQSKVISYRNDAGRYSIPDVSRLKAEKEEDR